MQAREIDIKAVKALNNKDILEQLVNEQEKFILNCDFTKIKVK